MRAGRLLRRGAALRRALRAGIGLEQRLQRDARGRNDVLVAIVAERQPNRFLFRRDGQLLGVLGRDEQRDGRHLDRLLVLLLDVLTGGEDADVLQDDLALLVALGVFGIRGLPGDEYVDA